MRYAYTSIKQEMTHVPQALLSLQADTSCRAVGIGVAEKACAPPPTQLFGRKLKKKNEDYHFTVENTELITQRYSPFDFKNMLLGLIF